MKHFGFLMCCLLALGACRADESLASYGAEGTNWRLVELDGKPFSAQASMRFGPDGAVIGEAPCNGWSARQSAPYPWFELGPIRATRRACAALAEEQRFFGALAEMTQSEVSGQVLILTNEAGRVMEFRAAPQDGP